MDEDLEQPRKRARRGAAKKGSTAGNGAADVEANGGPAERKSRGSIKGSAPKKAKKQSPSLIKSQSGKSHLCKMWAQSQSWI
jgi:hypothetical protein